MRRFWIVAIFTLACTHSGTPSVEPVVDRPFVIVLGTAQDGGYPQAGCNRPHCEDGWLDYERRRFATSLALVDPVSGERWLFEATPDFRDQLRMLDKTAPADRSPGLSGIFLTHAHIGHYSGLVHLGREVLGARDVPVFAMARMEEFLKKNGPWNQLVTLGNISIVPINDGREITLNDRLSVTPFLVPHRDEYSETVGFRIDGPSRSAIFIPDIDKWERWDVPVETLIRDVDLAWLDGTFLSEGELPGRSMAEVPHPFIVESMERFISLTKNEKKRIRFIHLNHTNPALQRGSASWRTVNERGFAIAEQGERFEL